MIKLENVVLASPEQMEFIIEGMRNPMNSWDKSDSYMNYSVEFDDDLPGIEVHHPYYRVSAGDYSLMKRLSAAGTDHRKFMRMMPVYVRITAPLYWWKEFDTYKVGTVANSCSTMHKIAEKEFTIEDFSTDQLLSFSGKHNDERNIPTVMSDEHNECSPKGILECVVIPMLNECRNLYLNGVDHGGMLKTRKDKEIWWQMIQLLPSSYNQTRNVMLNYEVLANIYRQRKNHKLDEWREVCKWIESLPYSELITGLPIESDQAVEEKRFPQPFPWNKDDVYCDNCEHFHDCLNKGGLADVTTSDDIVKNGFGRQHYVNKPGYDCPKKVQSQLAEDDPMNFSVGKIVHDLMAKELTEDVKKQILEEDSK